MKEINFEDYTDAQLANEYYRLMEDGFTEDANEFALEASRRGMIL